jgi:nucleoside-diphosphate-sugar epimerase/2-polyprenyl-3-methyl-5-hydroxy-6-metoxy-1,4-benzoquinol methylase
MNVLITGGTGFIGSRLARRCLERGDKVRVLGQVNTEAEEQNRQFIEGCGVECLLGSVLDKDLLDRALSGIEVVFHLAAVQHEMNVPDKKFRDINVEGTRKLLDTCLRHGVGRIVHGSTIGVYGKLHGVVEEQSPCTPDNIYGITKLEGEQLALSYADRLDISVVRIPEVYGPGDRRLFKLFKVIWKNKFFVIGSGKNLHHLIYVEDLIDGIFLLSRDDAAVGEVFLLAGEKAVSTREMAETIAHTLGKKLPRWNAPLWPFMVAATLLEKTLRPLGIQPPLHRRRMDFFVKGFSLSSAKAAGQLGFSARTSFAEGVAKTAKWYQEQGLLPRENFSSHDKRSFIRVPDSDELTAKMEPFDSFWEAPEDIEKGYSTFGRFYRENYLCHVPTDKNARILVISCGPGYFVNVLKEEGYLDVLGIDCDPQKISFGTIRGLNCRAESAFSFLKNNEQPYDMIFAEQEVNHLTKEEIVQFLKLCRKNLTEKGRIIVHSLNGANPITGAALAQNFDHFNSLTEYSLKQVLYYSEFVNAKVFPLNLYVFYSNPLNYVAMLIHYLNVLYFRFNFKIYGKANRIFTKKIAAVAYNS